MSLIPLPYRILIGLAICAALFAGGWWQGYRHVHAEWDAAMLKQSLKVANVEKRQAETTVQVVTQYVDRVQVVRQRGATIIKEVPVYVTQEADAACVLPRGFARLHDDAAANRLPDPAGDADATPAGVALSAAAGTIANNYQRCHENAEQLIALQSWIKEAAK